MYVIEIRGVLACCTETDDESYALISGNMQDELNRAGSLTFTVSNKNVMFHSFTGELLRQNVSLYYIHKRYGYGWTGQQEHQKLLMWTGRVIKYQFETNGTVEFECEGALSFLNDIKAKRITENNKGYGSWTGGTLLYSSSELEDPDTFKTSSARSNQSDKPELYECAPREMFCELINWHNSRIQALETGAGGGSQVDQRLTPRVSVGQFDAHPDAATEKTISYYDTSYWFPLPERESTMEYIQQNFINNEDIGGVFYVDGSNIWFMPDTLWDPPRGQYIFNYHTDPLFEARIIYDATNLVTSCMPLSKNGKSVAPRQNFSNNFKKYGLVESDVQVRYSYRNNSDSYLVDPRTYAQNHVRSSLNGRKKYEISAIDNFYDMNPIKHINYQGKEFIEDVYYPLKVGQLVLFKVNTYLSARPKKVRAMCTSSNVDLVNPLKSKWEFNGDNLTDAQYNLYYEEYDS